MQEKLKAKNLRLERPNMDICRTRFKKEIITEFVPASNKNSKKVMIFCAGVPGVPHKDEVLEFWAKKGYWTFFPRYRGTWESDGIFLAQSPEQDILDVIDCLSDNFKDYWSGQSYQITPKSITIVGSSFGGPAAILASRDPRVNKAICISPVVDWKAEDKSEPLDALYILLQEAYGAAYRLNKKIWNKLANGNFYNPINHIEEIDGQKILIFHAKDDDIVKIKPVKNFALKTKSHFIILNKGGHLSSSILMSKRYYQKVKKFMAL